MTIENGGEQPANDTALSNAQDQTDTNASDNTTSQEGGDSADNDDLESREPEWAEIEVDGKKYKVEAAAKDGYLRQSDYSRKTLEVAEARRALDADRDGFVKHTEAQKAHFQVATKLAALNEQLEPYTNVDWTTLYQNNPDLYQQHRINFDQLKDKRDAVARDYSQKEQERIQNENRESGNRVQKVQTEIARLIPEWTPGGELDVKLSNYGIGLGFTAKDLAETAIRNPQFVHQLNRLRLFDEAAKKTKTQQTFEKTQQAQPVTRVGGNSGSASRKTTDSSGDALSTQEWMRREEERLAAKRPQKRQR